jgi:hypothetical protein
LGEGGEERRAAPAPPRTQDRAEIPQGLVTLSRSPLW